MEGRAEKTDSGPEKCGRRAVTLYLKEVENDQREQDGLPLISLTEEELRW